jgi:SET domain-containing protein
MKLVEGGRFAIRPSFPGTGDGLFAVTPLRQGAFVLEYTGMRVPTPSAEENDSRYLFLVDDEWTIDGTVPENLAGYINHGCMPNCEAALEEKRIMIYALRDIQSGEELTIDYGEEYFDKFIAPVGCKCATCINPRSSELN